MATKRKLTTAQGAVLLKTLKARFEKNMNRHKGIEWAKVHAKLDPAKAGEKLWSLNEMEATGGEPDVVAFDKKTGEHRDQHGRRTHRDKRQNEGQESKEQRLSDPSDPETDGCEECLGQRSAN